MKKANIGLIGLAVMGENLVMNMESKGFSVAVYNRSVEKTRAFVRGRALDKNIIGCESLKELVTAVESPRKIMMMIRAGEAVDMMIDQLIPLMDEGDIIIDGGNSNYQDTIRRMKLLNQKKIMYVGTGVSGGEEGALNGPCLMPGGNEEAWSQISDIFKKISAEVEGTPCCSWIGNDGAGHFVKMVHNGIEYGDMQLICEAYQLMRDGVGLSNDEMHQIFKKWNETDLNSYLIEITRDILGHQEGNGEYTVDKILDVAGQKGTGKWTCLSALEEGIPLTLISEAVFSRCIAAKREERVQATRMYKRQVKRIESDTKSFVEKIGKALYASKIISYTQGYALLKSAAEKYDWKLNYGEIALIWRGGCIIRSVFLDKINEAYSQNAELQSLLLDPFFYQKLQDCIEAWRGVVSEAMRIGVPVPAMSSALSYFDSYTCSMLPANLLQAQRDYFGAHTYERTDRPRGEMHHTNWTGHSGNTSAANYVV